MKGNKRMETSMRRIMLALIFSAGACSSKQETREMNTQAAVSVPKLEIRDDLVLELVNGTKGASIACKNEQGQVFRDYSVSDVVYRVRGGYLEKVENLGCPVVQQETRKPLTDQMRDLLALSLEEMETITVKTEEKCVSDGTYAGVRLANTEKGEQFVYIIPKSKVACKGSFVSIADWELILDQFNFIFSMDES
jgi:hypothetical protein